MQPFIDHSVYPDRDELGVLKSDFASDEDRADYLARVCGAWDFDLRPDPETFELFRGWRTVFDAFPVPHSPAYHTFRELFGWPPVPVEGSATYEPPYMAQDRREGRSDPCERMI